jgi:hypothetical protein
MVKYFEAFMRLPIPAARFQFGALTQALSASVEQLQYRLDRIQIPTNSENSAFQLGLMGEIVKDIEKNVARLTDIQTLTLFDQEYTFFCDLIMCGSEMAKYLSTVSKVSQQARAHANYWRKISQEFKPYLNGIASTANPLDLGQGLA